MMWKPGAEAAEHKNDVEAAQQVSLELEKLRVELRQNFLEAHMLHIDMATALDPNTHVALSEVDVNCDVCKEALQSTD